MNFKVFADDGVTQLHGNSRDMTLTSWYGDNFKIEVNGDTSKLGNYYEIIIEDVATFEDAHGNTAAEATELIVGTDYDSSLDYNSTIFDDQDWFVFTPAGNTLYQVTFTNHDYNWKYYYIYQDKGHVDLTLATNSNAHYATSSKTFFLDGTEPCYIKIGDSAGTYKLRVDQLAVYPPDSYGQNCSEVTPLTVNAAETIGTISPDQAVNNDWFVLNTTALHEYHITLTKADNSDAAFSLYSADCSTRLHSRTREITVVSWFGEDFKILVDAATSKLGNQYTIKVEDVETHVDDFPNLSTLATVIKKDGTVYNGTINYNATVQPDNDWLKFVAPIDGSYEFSFRNFDYNWKYYYLYSIDDVNKLHQVFSRNSYFSTDAYSRELTAGTHYIQILEGIGEYQISVISPEPRCGDLDHQYPIGDINEDCFVNMEDLALMTVNWLTSTAPNEQNPE